MIGYDAIAHDKLWGSSGINLRGSNLMDYLISTELDILNSGNKPTFFKARRAEVIEITLCTPILASKVRNWRMTDEPTISDHAMIAMEL